MRRSPRILLICSVAAGGLPAGCLNSPSLRLGERAERSGRYDVAYEYYCDEATRHPASGEVQAAIARVAPRAALHYERQAAQAVEAENYTDAWKLYMQALTITPDDAAIAGMIKMLEQHHPEDVAPARAAWRRHGDTALAVRGAERSWQPPSPPSGPTADDDRLAQASEAPPDLPEEIASGPEGDEAEPTVSSADHVAHGNGTKDVITAEPEARTPPEPPKGPESTSKPEPAGEPAPPSEPVPASELEAPSEPESTSEAKPRSQPEAPGLPEAPGEPESTSEPEPRPAPEPPRKPDSTREREWESVWESTDERKPPSESGEYLMTAILSVEDRRFPRRTHAFDDLTIRLKDTDSDPDADLDIYLGTRRIRKVRDIEPGQSVRVRGRSGKHYEVVVITIVDRTESVRIGIRALSGVGD